MKWLTPSRLIKIKKPTRFNPHQYWLVLLCGFLVILTAELLYFSWFFLHTTKALDAVVLPNLETNAPKIKNMEKKLDTIEAAVQDRTKTSQNESPVVQ
jgi:hypothetical protein